MPNRRRYRVTILSEDLRHERFARALLPRLGHIPFRFRTAPPGDGSAEQWVRKEVAEEVKVYRSGANHQRIALLVVTDGDRAGGAGRKAELEEQIVARLREGRAAGERIVLLVPAWSIETWLLVLNGRIGLTETTSYKNDYSHAEKAGIVSINVAVAAWPTDRAVADAYGLPSLTDAVIEATERLPS